MDDLRPDEERRFKIHFTRSDFFGNEETQDTNTSKDAGLFLLAYKGSSGLVDVDKTFWCWQNTANANSSIFSYATKERDRPDAANATGPTSTQNTESKAFRATFSSNKLPEKADSIIVLNPDKGEGRLVRVFSRYAAINPYRIGTVPPVFSPDRASVPRPKRPISQPHPEPEAHAIIVESPQEKPAQLPRTVMSTAAKARPKQTTAVSQQNEDAPLSLPLPRPLRKPDVPQPSQVAPKPVLVPEPKPVPINPPESAAPQTSAAKVDEKKARPSQVQSEAQNALSASQPPASSAASAGAEKVIVTMSGKLVAPSFSSSEDSNSEKDD